MAGGKMLVQIVKQLTEAQALPAAGYRAQDLLRLTAVAMGRDDQAAGDDVGGFAAEIFTHQMQTRSIPPRCRRKSSAKHRPRKGRPPPPGSAENGTAAPRCNASGCRLAAIEQPGGGENEHPGTDRNNPTSAGVGGSQRGAQRLQGPGRRRRQPGTTIVSAWREFRTAVGHQADAAGGAQRPFIDGGDGELVPVSPISGRGRPKISTATPNSKVHRPS